MYLLYMGLCIVSGILVYFFVPETKGLPMEELAALFGDEVVVHLTKDGTGFVKGDDAIAKAEHFEGKTLHVEGQREVRPVSAADVKVGAV